MNQGKKTDEFSCPVLRTQGPLEQNQTTGHCFQVTALRRMICHARMRTATNASTPMIEMSAATTPAVEVVTMFE